MQHIQICILSGQSLPNLLPVCLLRPEKIVLAVSPDMQGRLQPMMATLLQAGLVESTEDVITLPNMPDHDYSNMLKWSRQLIDMLRQHLPNHHITLNATGGTKLMSQALTSACLEHPEQTSVLYCDTAHDCIEWLAPQIKRSTLPVQLLDSATILKANGIERESSLSDDPQWCYEVQQRRELTQWLGSRAGEQLSSFFPVLNNALHDLKPESLPHQAAFKQKPTHHMWRQALRNLENNHLIRLSAPLMADEPAQFQVSCEQALRYLRGGWLEEYLWLCLRDAGLQDVHCSQEIRADLGTAEHSKLNELDIVVGHRNRMLVIECKTADLTQKNVYNQILDKLESLGKRTGGLLTQCWLVAARWPRTLEEQTRLRLLANSRGITLVEPRHLADLPARLQSWKTQLRLPLN